MAKIVFIDGIGDYSRINNQYRKNVPDYQLLFFTECLKSITQVLYIDVREKKYNKEFINSEIIKFSADYIFIKCTSVALI